MAEPSLCPWLLYSHDDMNYRNNIFCNIAGYPRQSSSIPFLQNKTILGSSHGWLILKKKKTDSAPTPDFYYLWNPITLKSRHFPPFYLNPDRRIAYFILSSDPDDDDPNSFLLLFESGLPYAFVCRLSHRQWIEVHYVSLSTRFKFTSGKVEIDYNLHSPVSYNGNVFAIGGRHLYRVQVDLDISNRLQRLIDLPLFPARRSRFLLVNLVECCGELYVVYCFPSDVQDSSTTSMVAVHVFKLDFCKMIWEKVDNIQNHAFFLSFDSVAISCAAAELSKFPALRNRIHFTMKVDVYTTILFFYHVEDGTLTMCPPCLDLPKPWSSPLWVTLPTLGTNIGEQKEDTLKALAFAEERKDNKENVFPWADLPVDLQKLILEKLSPFDYMNFRAICRMNRLVAPPIQWRTKLAGSDNSNLLHSLSPCLIYSPAGKKLCNFLDPNLNGRYLIKTPEPFQYPIVRCCKESWLLISESWIPEDSFLSLLLFNPFTKAAIRLPDMKAAIRLPFDVDRSRSAGRFSLLPYSSDHCYVVCFLNFRYNRVNFLVSYPGSDQWHTLAFPCGTEKFYPVDNAPVIFNNSIYYLCEDEKLGVLTKTEQGVWQWGVLYVKGRPDAFQYNYLVECDGELLSVFVGYSGKWVKVFMLCGDDSHKIDRWWEPVDDLGKHVLYLSRLSTFSKVAQVEGTNNRIYFERLYRERAIFYSLNTKKFHTSYDKESWNSFYHTSEPLLSAWIEPNWSDKLPQRDPWIER